MVESDLLRKKMMEVNDLNICSNLWWKFVLLLRKENLNVCLCIQQNCNSEALNCDFLNVDNNHVIRGFWRNTPTLSTWIIFQRKIPTKKSRKIGTNKVKDIIVKPQINSKDTKNSPTKNYSERCSPPSKSPKIKIHHLNLQR